MKKNMLLSIGLALLTISGGGGGAHAGPMGAVAILRGVNGGAGSVASVELPYFTVSSLPSGTVLYSGAASYGDDSTNEASFIGAGPSQTLSNGYKTYDRTLYGDGWFADSVFGVVRRASGQVLVDFYAGRVGQGGAGRPGRPSPQPFTTHYGDVVYPNYLNTATLPESGIIEMGYSGISYGIGRNGTGYYTPSGTNPNSAFFGLVGSSAAFGTADPAQFGSTILEESRAAGTAYPSGSMSSSASGNRITCRMN